MKILPILGTLVGLNGRAHLPPGSDVTSPCSRCQKCSNNASRLVYLELIIRCIDRIPKGEFYQEHIQFKDSCVLSNY